MKFRVAVSVFLSILTHSAFAQPPKTDLLILGSDHLAQIYNRNHPQTDVFLPKRQAQINEFIALAIRYKPEQIMVEVLPERQKEIDSLYTLYRQDKLTFEALPDGRSEVYQLAFRMGKQLGVPKIDCVNAPGGTSQSILDNGENIELYKKEGVALRAMVTGKMADLQNGSLSLKDYLVFLNQPETINKVYHLRYITPARVINGTFKNPDAMVDTAFVNPKYIGAELTSVFKNRDYKIYSNMVTAQRATKAKRALLIIGVAHIGSLKSIFRDDDEFNLINAQTVLRR